MTSACGGDGAASHTARSITAMVRVVAIGVMAVMATACSTAADESGPDATASASTTTTTTTAATTTTITTTTATTTADTTTRATTTTTTTGPVAAPPTTSPTPPGDPIADCIAAIDLAERVALLVWPAVYLEHWDAALAAVADHGVGGVMLMRVRDVTAGELTDQLADLRSLASYGLAIATDEEGGEVQRLRDLRPLPSQAEVSATMSADDARTLIAEHGRFVRSLGIDLVLGPVVDVLPETGPPPLQPSRFFEGDADTVTEYGIVYVAGWNEAGLGAVVKHAPGHGRASADTHIELARTPALDELAERDLVPFGALAQWSTSVTPAPEPFVPPLAAMIGHLDVPGLTDGAPASLSAAAVDHLRTELGFADALVISDALEMGAIDLDLPDAAVAAITAGVDVVLFVGTTRVSEVIDALLDAVADATMSVERIDEAATRVLRNRPLPDACAR